MKAIYGVCVCVLIEKCDAYSRRSAFIFGKVLLVTLIYFPVSFEKRPNCEYFIDIWIKCIQFALHYTAHVVKLIFISFEFNLWPHTYLWLLEFKSLSLAIITISFKDLSMSNGIVRWRQNGKNSTTIYGNLWKLVTFNGNKDMHLVLHVP